MSDDETVTYVTPSSAEEFAEHFKMLLASRHRNVTWVTPRNMEGFVEYSKTLLTSPYYLDIVAEEESLRGAWEAAQTRLAEIPDPPHNHPPTDEPKPEK